MQHDCGKWRYALCRMPYVWARRQFQVSVLGIVAALHLPFTVAFDAYCLAIRTPKWRIAIGTSHQDLACVARKKLYNCAVQVLKPCGCSRCCPCPFLSVRKQNTSNTSPYTSPLHLQGPFFCLTGTGPVPSWDTANTERR